MFAAVALRKSTKAARGSIAQPAQLHDALALRLRRGEARRNAEELLEAVLSAVAAHAGAAALEDDRTLVLLAFE
jgi:serine phosphatase RsbU (regulator of sigma subunit)